MDKEMAASFRSWAATNQRCKKVRHLIVAGRMTPTEACHAIGVHHHTYSRWQMTNGADKLIRAVLKSNIKPVLREEIVKRLSGKKR